MQREEIVKIIVDKYRSGLIDPETYVQEMAEAYKLRVGDTVCVDTGDYKMRGEVRAVFTSIENAVKYVVQLGPFLKVFSDKNLKLITE